MGVVYHALAIVLIAVLAFVAGRVTHECPKPKDPEQVIRTYEVIRNVDRPVVTREVQTVEKIVERPVYRGSCFDDDGLRAVNNLIQGTAAGRRDIGSWSAENSAGPQPQDSPSVDNSNDSAVSAVSD